MVLVPGDSRTYTTTSVPSAELNVQTPVSSPWKSHVPGEGRGLLWVQDWGAEGKSLSSPSPIPNLNSIGQLNVMYLHPTTSRDRT